MDKVTCPYCGAEMEISKYDVQEGGVIGYQYFCEMCDGTSPIRSSKDEALAAALRRYVEPNRVLTLEELGKADHERNLYFETRDFGPDDGDVFESSVVCAQETFCDEDEGTDARKEYGVRVRCWLRRPTDEERASTPWTQTDT